MNALIPVQTTPNGQQAVSARDLHEFLEIKRDFTTWCKKMFTYGFEEGIDFTQTGESVNQYVTKIDYALTLDTAKEISMIQRTEKGKLARQYFIECEKKLTQVKQVIQPAVEKLQRELARKDQEIAHLNRLMLDKDARIADARQMIDFQTKQGERWHAYYQQTQDTSNFYRDMYKQETEISKELRKKVLELAPAQSDQAHAQVELPPISTGTRINRLVRQFAADNADKISFEETWNWLYREFRDRYHVDPLRFVLKKSETRIGKINEMGMLEQLLSVAEFLFLKAQAA